MSILTAILHPVLSYHHRRFHDHLQRRLSSADTRIHKGCLLAVTHINSLPVGASHIDVYPKPPADSGNLIDFSASRLFDGITPDDIVQCNLAICYILAVLITLSNTDDGDAYLQTRIFKGATPWEVVCVFTRNGLSTAVHVDSRAISNQVIQTGPTGDYWVAAFLCAYAFFRTGADTYASLNYGFTNAVATDLGLPNNLIQPRNVDEFYAMAASGLTCTILTPPTPTQPGMVGGHAYGWDGALRNPWGPSGGMPLHISITDLDVARGVTLCVNVAPPKVAAPTPPVTIPPVQPQDPTVPISKPSKPNVNVKSYGTEVSWDSGDPACTLYRAFDVTMVNAVVIGNFKAGQSSCIDAIPTVPVFYVLKNAAGVFGAVTGPVDPPNMPTTVPPVTIPAVGPIAAELSAHGLTLFAADFAAKYPGK